MSLTKRKNRWYYSIYFNGERYRGSCKTSKAQEAKKVESLILAQLLEDRKEPGSKKISKLSDFSHRFFSWLDALPTDRPPKESTRKYYRIGWKLLQKTSMAGRRLDHITRDHIASLVVGSSPANTNNALRTLRRMLRKAQEWQLIRSVPSSEPGGGLTRPWPYLGNSESSASNWATKKAWSAATATRH